MSEVCGRLGTLYDALMQIETYIALTRWKRDTLPHSRMKGFCNSQSLEWVWATGCTADSSSESWIHRWRELWGADRDGRLFAVDLEPFRIKEFVRRSRCFDAISPNGHTDAVEKSELVWKPRVLPRRRSPGKRGRGRDCWRRKGSAVPRGLLSESCLVSVSRGGLG